MAKEFAYTVVTNDALKRSQVGGILAHIVSRSGLNLMGARMYAPSVEMTEEYARIVHCGHSNDENFSALLSLYVSQKFAPSEGQKKRILFLLFEGENALEKLRQVCEFSNGICASDSVRNIYGSVVPLGDKQTYFEPAVIFPYTDVANEDGLRLFGKYYDSDGGILNGVEKYPEGMQSEITLAMIKPDNFRFPNSRPGNILNFFCSTGLNLIGMKVQKMSTTQAIEFYGPVKEVFKRIHAERLSNLQKTDSGIDLEMDAPNFKFDQIVRYMSGRSEKECSPDSQDAEGTATSMVLIFEGPDAIRKIRTILGATNPAKAAIGTIRREFGSNITENSAHASDSPESVRREMDILIYRAPDSLRRCLLGSVQQLFD